MKLFRLINALREVASKPFILCGPNGLIKVRPERKSEGITYWVDCSFCHQGRPCLQQHGGNFRLSTVCCLCVGVLYGEQQLTSKIITAINANFEPPILLIDKTT